MSNIAKFNKDGHFQRIRAHYLDDKIVLTEFEEKKLERMKYIFSLRLKNKFSKQQAITKCEEEFGVSKATAYRDYAMSSTMFGELDEVNTKGERLILREEYWFLYQQLVKERNWPEAKRVLDSYKELFDFTDKDGVVEPDKIAAHEYHIKISKASAELIKNALDGPVIDLNNFGVEDAEIER